MRRVLACQVRAGEQKRKSYDEYGYDGAQNMRTQTASLMNYPTDRRVRNDFNGAVGSLRFYMSVIGGKTETRLCADTRQPLQNSRTAKFLRVENCVFDRF